MKIRKGIPLIDQHDKYGFWGGKFGGNYIPETLKKPVEDLTFEFQKLRKDSITAIFPFSLIHINHLSRSWFFGQT